MLSYIIKLITLIVFAGFTVFSYYKDFPFHVENASGYGVMYYAITVLVTYSIYKLLSYLVFNDVAEDKVKMSYTSMFLYALLNLLIICIVYFATKDGFSGSQGVGLFFKILGFLILPVTIFTASYGFGNKILSYIKGFEKEESTFRFLSSLGFGFFAFVALIHTFGAIGFYNIYTFFIILIPFIVIGYKSIGTLYADFFTKEIVVEKDIQLYTSEFLFIIITALISTNLVLVFRPFPIGWDDLGAYMNIPNLFAAAGELVAVGGIKAWELYTGIGFMFGSATQAFYLNTFSGIIASITLYLFGKSFFKEKNEFINIPLLLVAIFVSMPMVVFQLGKDMKLDIGLFSISLIATYMIYYIFIKKEEFVGDEKGSLEENNHQIIGKIGNVINRIFRKEFFKKEDFYYMFIAGIIVGFAFAIKLTTLMLISSIIGIILFSRIGIDAFLGYSAVYFAIFTKFKLWDLMNVVYPKNDISFINNFSLISLIIGISLLTYAYIRHNKEYIIKTLLILSIFLAGIFVAIIPWIGKNIYDVGITNISIGGILGGKPEYFNPDYTKIHTSEELAKIQKNIDSRQSLDANGQAVNADMGRYFGYEQGINNYLKIPYSLTMQSNQRGEYTDITYIFFALLPVLFLFIPLKKAWYYIVIYSTVLFEVLYYILPGSKVALTSLFNKIELPLGYAVIFGAFIASLLFFKFATNWKKDKMMKLFIVNLVFTVFYVFLWDIAAFGIVWYGITMYMCLLIFIGIGLHYITRDDPEIDNDNNLYTLKAINFFAIFIIISIYFVKSAIPHMFTNFNEDSYMHYKAGLIKENEAIFAYHSDYINILFELNIKEEKKKQLIIDYKKDILDFFSKNNFPEDFKNALNQINNINQLNDFLNFFILNGELKNNLPAQTYQLMVQTLTKTKSKLYNELVSPSKENKSDAIIYRMGTFIKYFVTENHYRLYDDSLIFTFDDYIYNKDIDKTVDNFKNIGMKYILVDLNTPTIDKDPRHSLTTRFENLLKTFTSKRLEIIDSDSICLKTAIDLYNKSNKTPDDLNNYVRLAGVNFESYDKDNNAIGRTSKLIKCYDVINYLVDNNLIDNNNFSYLVSIKDELKKQTFASDEEKYKFLFSKIPSGFKALFKIIE
ncbi:MAG: hypothetical protein WC850_01260 [Candidatus Gracilibacteria bacterium]